MHHILTFRISYAHITDYHIIIIIIIIVIFIFIIICLYNVMYFQYTSLSIHLYKEWCINHYSGVIVSAIESQISGVSTVCAILCSGADQGKYQRSTLLASVRGIHRRTVDSPPKGPVTWKSFHLMTSSWFCEIFLSLNEHHTKKQCCVSMVCFKYGIHKYLSAEWFELLITMDCKATITWSLE